MYNAASAVCCCAVFNRAWCCITRALHGVIILALCLPIEASPSATFYRLCVTVAPVVLLAGSSYVVVDHGATGGLKRRLIKKIGTSVQLGSPFYFKYLQQAHRALYGAV